MGLDERGFLGWVGMEVLLGDGFGGFGVEVWGGYG